MIHFEMGSIMCHCRAMNYRKRFFKAWKPLIIVNVFSLLFFNKIRYKKRVFKLAIILIVNEQYTGQDFAR